ncbi:MAG: sulfate reduction electron transfer complex DsrMKJOP subunit DsrJ [Desulfovibrionaceae bacterium]|jgi:hypothetical protein|nr:sulfate reduction electron transfer complex DsrMKJOP subunit DsrJ [Desulfovibrionaceae bacterium]
MYNGKYIIPGLVIFAILLTVPFWYNLGSPGYATPELKLPAGEKNCIESTEWMKAEHMQLLNIWRDNVVRMGNRVYTASNGKKWDISLQNTCMKCHTNKAEFCDKCHDTNSVDPYCWTCHVAPRGNE